MKRIISLTVVIVLLLSLCSCSPASQAQVVATTLPVYAFTRQLCEGTDITVSQLITDNISCLHDYTLQVSQMRMLESAQTIICSGAGLEDFFLDLGHYEDKLIDASVGIDTLCFQHAHNHMDHEDHAEHNDHTAHSHTTDPHIWLSPLNAGSMAQNISENLCALFPQHQETIHSNLERLREELHELYEYGTDQLSQLSSRKLITFHDGFSYFAHCFDLTIAYSVEEESGSEAAASQLVQIINIIETENLRALFTETNGSTAAAQIISTETDVPVYTLDMVISGNDYFDAMYRNINTIKEALG